MVGEIAVEEREIVVEEERERETSRKGGVKIGAAGGVKGTAR